MHDPERRNGGVQTRRQRTLVLWGLIGAAIALGGLALVACGGEGGGGSGLSGTIEGDGSSTVFPITEAVAEEFGSVEPNVDVLVGISGTGGGFEKFCAGDTDFSNASRPIKDEEAAICEENGITYKEFEVAFDGLSVVVNPAIDFVDCLTVEELHTIGGRKQKAQSPTGARCATGFPTGS